MENSGWPESKEWHMPPATVTLEDASELSAAEPRHAQSASTPCALRGCQPQGRASLCWALQKEGRVS